MFITFVFKLLYNLVTFVRLSVLLRLRPKSFFQKKKQEKKESQSVHGAIAGGKRKRNKGWVLCGCQCLCRSLLRHVGWMPDVLLNVFFDCPFDKIDFPNLNSPRNII